MASVIVLRGDEAETVYDDRWQLIVAALGSPMISRATEVEYDHKCGQWRAVHLATGLTIGSGKHRGQVIQQEVAWLEQRMIHSKSIGGKDNEPHGNSEG